MTASALRSTSQEEAEVLAYLMIAGAGFDSAAAGLSTADFGEPLYAEMFARMLDLAAANRTVNILTVGQAMANTPAYEALGGMQVWADLTGSPLVFLAPSHIPVLKDMTRRRALLSAIDAAAARLKAESEPVETAVNGLEGALASAISPDVLQRTYTLQGAIKDALQRIEAMARNEIAPGIMASGLQDWNDITGGMNPGDYILLGGRPSMGKTALSLSVAWRTAKAGHGVLYISREMDIVHLMPRILADLLFEAGGKAGFDEIKRGQVGAEDMVLLQRIEQEVAGWPLVIVDPEHFGVGQLSPLIRRYARVFERRGASLGLVVIDYLGLVDTPDGKPNREQEVTAISKAIKSAARSHGVPILVLSQLNRGVEQRDDKRPQLSDLRDSGSLEQDADVVIFVYRDEYYLDRSEPDPAQSAKHATWEQAKLAARDRMDVYSAKNRQGETRRRKAYFFGAHQAVRNSDHYQRWGYN